MWTYSQKTGDLLRNGRIIATGYSGCDDGKNNPSMQAVHEVGPIPQGNWIISGPPRNTERHGPYVLTLNPAIGTNAFGRSGFLMHGDSVTACGTASKGCVILPRNAREQIWNSGDRDLEVVPESAIHDVPDQNA
jgi:hypothetical protein